MGVSLCRWLEKHPRLVLLGGNPVDPGFCTVLGLAAELLDPTQVYTGLDQEVYRHHLVNFWRDRRLALICFRQGLTTIEFDLLCQLLENHADSAHLLRDHLLEEHRNGHLPHVSLIFLDDLPGTGLLLPWSALVSLAWLHRDLNLLARVRNLSMRDQVDWREQLLATTLDLPRMSGELADFFANLGFIAEALENYHKDELVFALLEFLDSGLTGKLCLQLCAQLEALKSWEEEEDPLLDKRRAALQWITRRLAEQLMEQELAGPEHLHALVQSKILLYEEIPREQRPKVDNLQMLTSFVADPQKYYAEVENSHSPEVLETRLWRILEMLPSLVEAQRFDVACRVLDFSQRFGDMFDLRNKPDILTLLIKTVAAMLVDTTRDRQDALMEALTQMGTTGVYLLIDLADHQIRSVRRAAIDALIKSDQPVVPILFAVLKGKPGWHYLRNMLLLLVQLRADGPKVEALFRKSLDHPEANVRKEALPGIARLLKGQAAAAVAKALCDVDLEVQNRAAACLGVTGINSPEVSLRLAEILAEKNCREELAIRIVASINRLKPCILENTALESALIGLLGTNGFLGIGGRKGSSSPTLRLAVVQALGHLGSGRSRKVLARLVRDQNAAMADAVAESLARLAARSL